MRTENRGADQLRRTVITPNYLMTAEGSVLIEAGHTRVLCAATVENTVPPFLRNTGKGWVTAEYAMLPRATSTRTPREVTKGRPSGRTHEIQRLIGRSLRAAVDLSLLGERSVIIDCDVLQADGGTRTAAITGAYVALAIALGTLVKYKTLAKSPLIDSVAATSVGIVGGEPMLDLSYEEDSRADVDMNVVMTGSGKFVELQATSERNPFEDAELGKLIALARNGIGELSAIQQNALAQKAVDGRLPLFIEPGKTQGTLPCCARKWTRSTTTPPIAGDSTTRGNRALRSKTTHRKRRFITRGSLLSLSSRMTLAWKWMRWTALPAFSRRAMPARTHRMRTTIASF